jgi:asparagine synthase (glutamine-hydrolysing)
MSGIVGLLNLDGSSIDCGLLGRMMASLAFRGPDTRCVQPAPFAGFGHALLRITDESARAEQPFTLDRRQWIVADGRIDARQDLIAALGAREPDFATDASDAELILRAYRTWGEECVGRLLGDFTFAIWDGPRRRLFCARDHLGVKPFYYAELGRSVLFSNTLDCLRLHPRISRELNDAAIADFLLFGANQESDTTSFRDIQRLPPAHCITWSPNATERRRYWTLPVDEPIVFPRAHDYTDRFIELLRPAVTDRLRTGRVAVLMSGGLDSTTLAAVAARLMRERSTGGVVHALTSVYDRLVPDTERRYASLAADYLKIPIHFDVRDDETSIADWDHVVVHTPEPVENPPAFLKGTEFVRTMAAQAQVFLYGEGPDNALRYEWRPYLSHLVAGRRVALLARAVSADLLMHPRVPLWSSIRQIAGARKRARQWQQVFPCWLNDDFAARSKCRERWAAHQRRSSSPHPVRPLGYESFNAARWQPLFEDCDIQGALGRLEFRHPFLDLRLLQYMLALPAMPWCRNKLIIRRAMGAELPGDVLRRRKTTMPVSADWARVVASGFPRLVPAPGLSAYVNANRVPSAPGDVVELRAALRPIGLNYWLQDLATN